MESSDPASLSSLGLSWPCSPPELPPLSGVTVQVWVEHRDQGDHVLGLCPVSNAWKHSPCCEVREAMGKKGKEGRSEAMDSLFGLGPWASDQKPQNAWKICPSFLVSNQEKKMELGPAGECSCCLSSMAFNTLKARSHVAPKAFSPSPNLIPNNSEPSFTWLHSKSCFALVLGSILGVTFYVPGTVYILPHFILTNILSTWALFLPLPILQTLPLIFRSRDGIWHQRLHSSPELINKHWVELQSGTT